MSPAPPQPLSGRTDDHQWSKVSALIAETLGLHFPAQRLADLRRGLASAAGELGLPDAAACADWLLSAPLTTAQLAVLASHLTIGETYFFRDKKAFDALATRVLPDIIQARRGRDHRLRLWSAACCTGEEAYSLAIMLRQILPDIADWHVTILGTDINPRFLRKAVAGVYGEWSFRDAPSGFKEHYFRRSGQHYTLREDIRRIVTFEHVNLVADAYPAMATNTNAMDVILCRNVLMYFCPQQAQRVVANLHHALIDGGWLAVAPTEISQGLLAPFVTRNFPGAIFHQKADARRAARPASEPPGADAAFPACESPAAPASVPAPRVLPVGPLAVAPEMPPETPAPEQRDTPQARAAALHGEGRYAEAADVLLPMMTAGTPDAASFSLLARALANLGRLTDALAWCDRWIGTYKLDVAGHYVRAMVLLEGGQETEARRALQRALYLDPNLVLAHVALGTLERSRGRAEEADRHFANALQLLRRFQPEDVLPESDGLTAGRLTETLTLMREQNS